MCDMTDYELPVTNAQYKVELLQEKRTKVDVRLLGLFEEKRWFRDGVPELIQIPVRNA